MTKILNATFTLKLTFVDQVHFSFIWWLVTQCAVCNLHPLNGEVEGEFMGSYEPYCKSCECREATALYGNEKEHCMILGDAILILE